MSVPTAKSQTNLCVPQYTGVPFTYSPPDVTGFAMDFSGNVDLDTGWNGAFRYVLWNGTPAPDGAVQSIQDNTKKYLYFSAQIKNDPTFDGEDSIILAFNPDNVNASTPGQLYPNLQRLIIHPVVGGVGANDPNGLLPAGAIEYVKGYTAGPSGPGSGSWPAVSLDPPWITVRARSAGAGPFSWDVEVLIDNSNPSGPNLPTNSKFGLYVNLVRVDSSVNPNATQFTWPASTQLAVPLSPVPAILEADSLPATTSWGAATLRSGLSCTGVHFAPSDIQSNHSGVIALNKPNQFSVTLYNSGTSDAQNVSALFQIANYGLPAPFDWVRPGEAASNLIPNDPVTAPKISGGGGSVTLSTGSWQPGNNIMQGTNPPVTEQQYYQAHPDTCIRVRLDSTTPDTTFLNQSAYENFLVQNASEFTHKVTVGTNGYKLVEGQPQHDFNLFITRNETKQCIDAGTPNQRIVSQLVYEVNACHQTGQFLMIKKHKFAICDSVGAFAYGLKHEGDVSRWADELVGESLKQVNSRTYRLSVPPGQSAVLTTRIVPKGPAGKPSPCGKREKPGAVSVLLLAVSFLGGVVYRPRRGR
jgi:hypothetical protein